MNRQSLSRRFALPLLICVVCIITGCADDVREQFLNPKVDAWWRLVDEEGRPQGGAVGTLSWKMVSIGGEPKINERKVTTDPDGFIHVDGIQGTSVALQIDLKGMVPIRWRVPVPKRGYIVSRDDAVPLVAIAPREPDEVAVLKPNRGLYQGSMKPVWIDFAWHKKHASLRCFRQRPGMTSIGFWLIPRPVPYTEEDYASNQRLNRDKHRFKHLACDVSFPEGGLCLVPPTTNLDSILVGPSPDILKKTLESMTLTYDRAFSRHATILFKINETIGVMSLRAGFAGEQGELGWKVSVPRCVLSRTGHFFTDESKRIPILYPEEVVSGRLERSLVVVDKDGAPLTEGTAQALVFETDRYARDLLERRNALALKETIAKGTVPRLYRKDLVINESGEVDIVVPSATFVQLLIKPKDHHPILRSFVLNGNNLLGGQDRLVATPLTVTTVKPVHWSGAPPVGDDTEMSYEEKRYLSLEQAPGASGWTAWLRTANEGAGPALWLKASRAEADGQESVRTDWLRWSVDIGVADGELVALAHPYDLPETVVAPDGPYRESIVMDMVGQVPIWPRRSLHQVAIVYRRKGDGDTMVYGRTLLAFRLGDDAKTWTVAVLDLVESQSRVFPDAIRDSDYGLPTRRIIEYKLGR